MLGQQRLDVIEQRRAGEKIEEADGIGVIGACLHAAEKGVPGVREFGSSGDILLNSLRFQVSWAKGPSSIETASSARRAFSSEIEIWRIHDP